VVSQAILFPGGEYSDQYKYIAVVKHNGEMDISPPTQIREVTKINNKLVVVVGDVVVDRALFNGGDTIHVTGYLRAYDWEGHDVALPLYKPLRSATQGHAICTTPWYSVLTRYDMI
jgi:hypothetical protein